MPTAVNEPALVETDGLVKDYFIGGEVLHAVNGVSLSIARGEFVAIMGTSGSGKSTFMNLVGCLDVPSAGTLKLDGADTRTLDSNALADIRNRKIGFVFQQFNLLNRTTALDNVAVPLIYAGLGSRDRRDRARAALVSMGLENRLDHTPAKLSGGQQQRVAIARAVANAPRLLMADEPTGNLDPHTAEHVFSTLISLVRASGLAALIATHNLELAKRMDRRVTLKEGQVVELQ